MLKVLQNQGLPPDVAEYILRDHRRKQMRLRFQPVLHDIQHASVRTRISVIHDEGLAEGLILNEFLFHRQSFSMDGIRVEDISPYNRRALINTFLRMFPASMTRPVTCTRKRGMLLLNLIPASDDDSNFD